MSDEKKVHLKGLKPAPEVLEKFTTKDQWQLTYVQLGNITFIAIFMLLGAIMAYQKYSLMAIMCLATSVAFIISLISIKRGRVYQGNYLTTAGIIAGVFIVLFFAENFASTSLVFYRNAFFLVVMAISNELIALKRKQITIFAASSIVIWFIHLFVKGPVHFARNPTSFISSALICTLAVLISNMIISLLSNFTGKIIDKAEEARNDAESHLNQITKVLDESKNGLQVGNRLYEATQTATASISELNQIYLGISEEAEGLNGQTTTLSESSAQVKRQAEQMKASVQEQNNSISETSSAMAEISANLSNMSDIADRRRANMNEVLNSLDAQLGLIKKLVDEVNKVQESSDGIASFVQTVDKISSQTGLLAMNASIEAAHAGESGKGFSVIAQEIRKLSEQTTANAAQISEELAKNTEIVKSTTESVSGFEKYTLQTTEELRSTITAMEEILAGIGEMNKATQDVMRALQNIVDHSHFTGEIVDNVVHEFDLQDSAVEKISNFAQKLNDNVSGMDSQLSKIKTVVSGIERESVENVEVTKNITKSLNFQ